MTDSTGVTTRTATRLSLIEAIRQARPAERGWRRRRAAIGDAELADAILARLPEAEPDPALIDVRVRAETADLRAQIAEATAAVTEMMPGGAVLIGREHLDMLAARAAALQQQVAGVRPLLERFAGPGPVAAPARRQAAAEALRALDASAGEAVAADEPA